MGLRDFYDNDYKERIIQEERLGRIISRHLKEIIGLPKGIKILDVGCGAGSTTSFLSKDNFLAGLEISQEGLRRSHLKGIRAIKADVEMSFPFESNTFDIIICREVFEHLIEPIATLRQIHRVLKTDGVLYATVPNHFAIQRRIKILFGGDLITSSGYYIGDFGQWNYPHIRFFTWKGFKAFLREGGFSVDEDISPLIGLPRVIPKPWKARLRKWMPNALSDGYAARCRKLVASEVVQNESIDSN